VDADMALALPLAQLLAPFTPHSQPAPEGRRGASVRGGSDAPGGVGALAADIVTPCWHTSQVGEAQGRAWAAATQLPYEARIGSGARDRATGLPARRTARLTVAAALLLTMPSCCGSQWVLWNSLPALRRYLAYAAGLFASAALLNETAAVGCGRTNPLHLHDMELLLLFLGRSNASRSPSRALLCPPGPGQCNTCDMACRSSEQVRQGA
jgi:hypothetical protein